MTDYRQATRLTISGRNRTLGMLGLVFLLLAGCASAPQKTARPAVYFPPLPNSPRIQYLATFSTPNDLSGAHSPFLDFVLGSDRGEADLIKKPYGVAIHEGKIHVVDTRGPSYAVFDVPNQKFKLVHGAGNGKLQKPINITIDQDGTKYVTDTGQNQVIVFDRNDNFLRAFGKTDQFKPADVAIVGERLYVTDLAHNTIQVLDKQSGDMLFQIGKPGSKEGEFVFPTNLAVGPDNNLYVADTGNFRIEKFTLDGKYLTAFGGVGSGFGQFARPKGVALDHEGRIYAVDAAFENIQIFSPEGKLLLFFGAPGDEPENINLPTQLVIDYDNVKYFQKFADPKFKIEYLVLVASQFGNSKVNVYGYGTLEGMDYSTLPDASTPVTPSTAGSAPAPTGTAPPH
jgi:sugar lactone lactonase YvrE